MKAQVDEEEKKEKEFDEKIAENTNLVQALADKDAEAQQSEENSKK